MTAEWGTVIVFVALFAAFAIICWAVGWFGAAFAFRPELDYRDEHTWADDMPWPLAKGSPPAEGNSRRGRGDLTAHSLGSLYDGVNNP